MKIILIFVRNITTLVEMSSDMRKITPAKEQAAKTNSIRNSFLGKKEAHNPFCSTR